MLSWRQYLDQRFPNQFRIGICQELRSRSSRSQRRKRGERCMRHRAPAPTGDNGCRRSGGIDLSRSSRQFGGGIVGHATLVHDVSENASHYFNPPLAATNSRTLSMFSSRLPCEHLGSLAQRGHEVVHPLHFCCGFARHRSGQHQDRRRRKSGWEQRPPAGCLACPHNVAR